MRAPALLLGCLAFAQTVLAAEQKLWRRFTFTIEQITAVETRDISEDDLVLSIGVASGKKGRTSSASFDLGSITQGQTLDGTKRGISHVIDLPSNDSKNTTIVWALRNVPDPTEEKVKEVTDFLTELVVGVARKACKRNLGCIFTNFFLELFGDFWDAATEFLQDLINPDCGGNIAVAQLVTTKKPLKKFKKNAKQCTVVEFTGAEQQGACGAPLYIIKYCLQRGNHPLKKKGKKDPDSQPFDTPANINDGNEIHKVVPDESEAVEDEELLDEPDDDPDDGNDWADATYISSGSRAFAQWGVALTLPLFYML